MYENNRYNNTDCFVPRSDVTFNHYYRHIVMKMSTF